MFRKDKRALSRAIGVGENCRRVCIVMQWDGKVDNGLINTEQNIIQVDYILSYLHYQVGHNSDYILWVSNVWVMYYILCRLKVYVSRLGLRSGSRDTEKVISDFLPPIRRLFLLGNSRPSCAFVHNPIQSDEGHE